MARATADAGAAALVRRAALPGADVDAAAADLAELITASVPGATAIETKGAIEGDRVVLSVGFSWDPPGPRWLPVRFTLQRSAPLVVAP